MSEFLTHSGYPYLAVFFAAAIEGEVVFVSACALVGMGVLDPVGVLVAGALGGASGDQFYFYCLRGRLRTWLMRFSAITKVQEDLAAFMRQHGNGLILASRFLPGLRIAIPVACAHAGVSPLRFSALNLISSFAWAGAILLVVGRFGPQALARLGLGAWGAAILPAVLVLGVFLWLRKRGRPMARYWSV